MGTGVAVSKETRTPQDHFEQLSTSPLHNIHMVEGSAELVLDGTTLEHAKRHNLNIVPRSEKSDGAGAPKSIRGDIISGVAVGLLTAAALGLVGLAWGLVA
jgi:hypothetical protein